MGRVFIKNENFATNPSKNGSFYFDFDFLKRKKERAPKIDKQPF